MPDTPGTVRTSADPQRARAERAVQGRRGGVPRGATR
jgi:hypothetical protein